MPEINMRKTIVGVMMLVVAFVYYFSGIVGTLLLITSTLLGMIPHRWHVKKSLLMSTLMIPTILTYLAM
jgi:putative membrane protein